MEEEDKLILESEIGVAVGRAVSHWVKKNEIKDPVLVQANVMNPTCYIDDTGISHTGSVVVVNCHIVDIDEDDDDDY